jgi:hypothetical protein
MGTVTRIVEWKNRDTIQALEHMLSQAKEGRLTGMLFACKLDDKNHGMGITGDYAADPLPVSAIAGALFRLVNKYAQEVGGVDFRE